MFGDCFYCSINCEYFYCSTFSHISAETCVCVCVCVCVCGALHLDSAPPTSTPYSLTCLVFGVPEVITCFSLFISYICVAKVLIFNISVTISERTAEDLLV